MSGELSLLLGRLPRILRSCSRGYARTEGTGSIARPIRIIPLLSGTRATIGLDEDAV